jgi:hypothetical protein
MSGPELPVRCCCSDWIAGLARDHAGQLAGIARREGASASDALDVVQDAFHTLLGRPDIAALRGRPDEAARLLADRDEMTRKIVIDVTARPRRATT